MGVTTSLFSSRAASRYTTVSNTDDRSVVHVIVACRPANTFEKGMAIMIV